MGYLYPLNIFPLMGRYKFKGKLVIHLHHFSISALQALMCLNLFLIRVNCQLTFGLY